MNYVHRLERLVFSLLAMILVSAGAASAQAPTAAQQSAIRSACQSDFRAHCSGVSPGGADALQCLQKNLASLSPSCQSAVSAASPPPAASAPATTAPAATAPATTAPAATAPAAPAKPAATTPKAAPAPQLSPRQEMVLVRQSCGPDFRRFCSTVRLGGGGAAACLSAHAAQLSSTCKSALGSVAR
ncbi:cysteine rich repeat-containing protein [Kaistia dalseonensis]|uniref:Pyruvate/2-oxoglutarate dehydrogenase complex dihydrolipoamide acyltransferase (E2) component n=1 Tax=Kaistia dalseonensis TaxID=410840 RepID=A0ABU0H873_9HYPH|nr:cysteine rich repeat-containing protein [Kaistia dalseonensis]MCX5495910.1 cysteine rich repeat-containing protein [Kaistia dalseonensis]MDQ0438513.1 pyruvate/2-oxoglutarate dehydrogenase complex dihydrolipoamide acyltransferase (E2) component [Kaistia dalseonensis]